MPKRADVMRSAGSSPRVRGTRAIASAGAVRRRFIPACAGNARQCCAAQTTRPVHPRVCGERIFFSAGLDALSGSSPRVRGTPPRYHGGGIAGRFIPACAGNASKARHLECLLPVHPRVCGERAREHNKSTIITGSSPRVRGTHDAHERRRTTSRFIPACAGNAMRAGMCSASPAVHPRVCGERPSSPDKRYSFAGSSPRVRGTPRERPADSRPIRFIPACAGNAIRPDSAAPPGTVHPRVCGERIGKPAFHGGKSGSSPRVRGTLLLAQHHRASTRFIPACAGNALSRTAAFFPETVHPRVCGERFRGDPFGFLVVGSSPRVRGTPRKPGETVSLQRFIPACAGNALRASARRCPLPVHPRVCGERRKQT